MSHPAAIYHRSLFAMGTQLDLLVCNCAKNEAYAFLDQSEQQVYKWHEALNRFASDSLITLLNNNAVLNSVIVNGEIERLIVRSQELYLQTNGYFNPTIARWVDFWKERQSLNSAGLVSLPDELKEVCGMNHLGYSVELHSVRFQHPTVKLDFGAIAKGWVLDRLCEQVKMYGINQAFFSFGGSSIAALGTHPSGEYWPVAIAHAFNSSEAVLNLALTDACVSVSGYSANNLRANKSKRFHLINPKTGYPVETTVQIVVTGPEATVAEALSTALITAPEQETRELAALFKDYSCYYICYDVNNQLNKVDKWQ